MIRAKIEREYFEWLYDLVCEGRYSKENSYHKLLAYLHSVEFTYTIFKDSNRAEDGIDLRYRFAYYHESPATVESMLVGPCSILEMMVALAIRIEETMDDPSIGDRTGQWFWKMIVNLGLGSMYDRRFDEEYVEQTIDIFLNRDYEPDGRGGLFRVRDCEYDMRNEEIWNQASWFLDSIV